jgi:hypothetical protein
MYRETIAAINSSARLLAAIGIRAIVEGICEDKHCRVERNLEKSIDLLVEKGVLARHHADFLHLQRFLGNLSAHELTAPSEEELTAAIDIVENVLMSLYVSPETAKNMERSRAELAKGAASQRVQ